MNLFSFPQNDFAAFLLVLIRVSTVLFLFPVFSSNGVPSVLKAALALLIALFFVSQANIHLTGFPESPWTFALMTLNELLVGLTLGLLVEFFFASVRMAGQLAGYQMGFAIANVYDPVSGVQSSVLSNLGFWVTLIVFMLLNGHHIFIRTLQHTFEVIPIGGAGLSEPLFKLVMVKAAELFSMAIKIGAPAIIALLLTNASFGIVAKVVPQINILIVAFPINVAMGLIFFGIALMGVLTFTQKNMGVWEALLNHAARLMGG